MYLSGYRLITMLGAVAYTFVVINFKDRGDFSGHKCYNLVYAVEL